MNAIVKLITIESTATKTAAVQLTCVKHTPSVHSEPGVTHSIQKREKFSQINLI